MWTSTFLYVLLFCVFHHRNAHKNLILILGISCWEGGGGVSLWWSKKVDVLLSVRANPTVVTPNPGQLDTGQLGTGHLDTGQLGTGQLGTHESGKVGQLDTSI